MLDIEDEPEDHVLQEPLHQMLDILKEHVDPLQESSDNGIDLFIAAKTFIENL